MSVGSDGSGNPRAAKPHDSLNENSASPLGSGEYPTAYARLILKRAGIAPLAAVTLAAGALSATSASGQQARGARVTALAQTRVVIVSSSVRVGRNAGQSQVADVTSGGANRGANRGLTALPADERVSVQPCDPSRPQRGAGNEPRRLCQVRIINIP